MMDEPLLRQRIESYCVDKGLGGNLQDNVEFLVGLFNEHSASTAILSGRERNRLKRIRAMLMYKSEKLEQRDPEEEEKKKEAIGSRYIDYLTGDVSALDWIIRFVEQHSA